MKLLTLPHIPLIQAGDNLAQVILRAMKHAQITLKEDDIIVIAQKIVSKAEGRYIHLAEVTPSPKALALAKITGKLPALIEVILWDTKEIIRVKKNLLIVEHQLGFISANAGIDHSNVDQESDLFLRLPQNPDASAKAIRQEIKALTGHQPPVLIIDSHGRPWRLGTVGVTIGLSGLAPVQDLRGRPDLFQTPLEYTEVGFADQIAAAASLLMGQADEGLPVVLIRGLSFKRDETATAADVLRSKKMDMFR